MGITRRTFIGLSAATVGAVTLGGAGLRQARAASLPWHKGKVEKVYSICENCLWRCGIVASVSNGRVRKVEGYAGNPKSRGKLCPRGQGAVAQLYDPDRLKKPLIRVEGSKRGEGKYREATWDEALDLIASRMQAIKKEHGPEAIAFFGHGTGDTWFAEFLPSIWGSPNAAKPSVTVCTAARETASQWTFGRAIGGHEPIDWEQTKYIVLVGHHIGEDTHNTQLQEFSEGLRRGAKLVVVDPRFSTAAAKAHRWLPIKPGTDTALLLAWANVLVGEKLYDAAYVKKYTLGFQQLAAHVKSFTPEWASKITEIPADDIRAVAREMAALAPRAVIPPSRHSVWYGNDTQRYRAMYILNTLLGNYGVEGGFHLAVSPYLEKFPTPQPPLEPAAGGCSGASGSEEEPEGYKPRADKGKFFAKTTAIQELVEPMLTGKPYPIRGLIAYGTNLFNAIPNVPRTRQALEGLDLYVAIDVLPQEHVMMADVILPEAHSLERYDDLFPVAHRTPFIEVRFPAVKPMWDTKPGWWIARELGIKLGLGDFFPWKDIEEYLEYRLSMIGSSLEDARSKGTLIQNGKPYLADWEKEGSNPFATPSGKIELYSQTFADNGFDPLPTYEATPEPPTGSYRLLYGRSPVHTFSRTQNNGVLMSLQSENELWLNAGEAKRLGLENGQYVTVKNQDGIEEGPVRLKATERIRKDCVYLVHGFGHKGKGMRIARGRGASDSALQTRYVLDRISGGAGLRVNFVTVTPAAKPRLESVAKLARERSI